MIRPLAVFMALFAGGVACVSLLPSPPKIIAPRSAVAAQLRKEAEPAKPQPTVRVVYPAPETDGPQSRVVAGADAAPAAASMASVPAVQTALYPQVRGTSPDAAATTLVNEAAQAGTPSLNLNTASVDALNQIPGAGHIGRTIASHRPYRSVEDLLAKRVIRKSVYDRIKAQVAAE